MISTQPVSGRITAEISTDRALGALYGLAIGDALGMPTQELDRARARAILGSPARFRDAPADNPISHSLPAGSVTDDTLQCLLIANLLIAGGGTIEAQGLAEALLAWEREMAERGGVQIVIDTEGLRTYPGALEAAERGVRTGGDPRNRDYVAGHLHSTASAAGEALCMDPQTSGGLLAAIDPMAVSSLSDMWWRVGEVVVGDPAIVLR